MIDNTGIAKFLGLERQAEQFKRWMQHQIIVQQLKNRKKYFCIGLNKTGTTSLYSAFSELGFVMGNQRQAELLSIGCLDKNFESLIEYCETAEVFQDVPFSLPETYKYLDKAFPGSKFILSVRDSPEQWYDSLVKFHSKVFGKGKVPTVDDLKNSDYVYKGWAWKSVSKLHGFTERDNPYNKEKLISFYIKHNDDVISYFKERENDLLVINLSDKDSYSKFCNFTGVTPKRDFFPWENKTEEIQVS